MTEGKINTAHESLTRKEEIKGSSNSFFGLVFTTVFLTIGIWPLFGGGVPRSWSLAVAALFLAAVIIRPSILTPLNRLWTQFGVLLHKITNPIIIGAIFFMAVTPTALIMKSLGKDLLRRKIDRKATSYWIERTPPGPEPETMRRQF